MDGNTRDFYTGSLVDITCITNTFSFRRNIFHEHYLTKKNIILSALNRIATSRREKNFSLSLLYANVIKCIIVIGFYIYLYLCFLVHDIIKMVLQFICYSLSYQYIFFGSFPGRVVLLNNFPQQNPLFIYRNVTLIFELAL